MGMMLGQGGPPLCVSAAAQPAQRSRPGPFDPIDGRPGLNQENSFSLMLYPTL